MKYYLFFISVLMAPVHAWRFTGYEHRIYGGTSGATSGPGNPGYACHSVHSLNNKISSYRWENGGGYTLELFKGIDCTGTLFDRFSGSRNDPDLADTSYNDDISSYGTFCA